MTTRVFRSACSKVLHIVHETDTAQGVVTALCGAAPTKSVYKNAKATCDACGLLDNPLNYVGRIYINPEGMEGSLDTRTRLNRSDYVTTGGITTSRGDVLLDDFRIGPVSMADAHGIFHARRPLSSRPRCNTVIAFSQCEGVTTDRYAALRLLPDAATVTCIACVALPADESLALLSKKIKEYLKDYIECTSTKSKPPSQP